MNNKKGQSLIEVIFSVGVVILVLIGVVSLILVTAKTKQLASERQKAREFSELLIEKQILIIKSAPLNFWDNANNLNGTQTTGNTLSNYPGYTYDMKYSDCGSQNCTIIFTMHWGDAKQLSVERFFSRQGL
jgi:Tfp pilus assembly protein PilV